MYRYVDRSRWLEIFVIATVLIERIYWWRERHPYVGMEWRLRSPSRDTTCHL